MSNQKKRTSIYQEVSETPEAPYEPPRGQQLLAGCLASFRYVVILFAVSIILAAFALSFANDLFAFVKEDTPYHLTVREGERASEIAGELKEAGVIKYAFLFKLYMRVTDDEEDLIPGEYDLNAKMDYRALSKEISTRITVRESIDVVIPEGFTQDEIFTLLEAKGVCSKAELLEAASNYDFKYLWVMNLEKGEKRLEGYLFPDTYTFYVGDTATRVIGKFLANFNKKYDVDFKARMEEMGTNLHDIMTIAAMIESEAKWDEDRPYISSVIYNRLASNKFPYLQIDATVVYALGEHKAALTDEDLRIESPYNTYVVKGLPAGPICNPGYESIASALYPEESDYYYYVATPDGSHIFSKTMAEHQAAIQKAKKLFEEAETQTEEEGDD